MTVDTSGSRQERADPSMLDLLRLSHRRLFPPGGRDLYRQIAILTDMGEGDEVLVASCGRGITLEYFAREFGVQGSGVDDDPVVIEAADTQTREGGLQDRVHFQQGKMDDLPYRDGVFDVVVGELGLTSRADPADAIVELTRVLKPGGRLALVQLVWKAPVPPERQALLAGHLGVRPLMVVELKRILREAGIERLHTEAWSDEQTAFRRTAKKPFPDFSELFSFPEKLGILRRAWSRWGWAGLFKALGREAEVHRLLTKERILGLDMIKGKKTGATEEASLGEVDGDRQMGDPKDLEIESGSPAPLEEPSLGGSELELEADSKPPKTDTTGLPLFGRGDER